MRAVFVLGLFTAVLAASEAQAELYGFLRQLDSGRTTDPLVYSGAFDIYLFELASNSKNYDALSLSFRTPSNTFLNTSSLGISAYSSLSGDLANPSAFGFESPDSFIVIPDGVTPLFATRSDGDDFLQADYATIGGVTLVPDNGTRVPAAFFSVPAGTPLSSLDFISGAGISRGGSLDLINLWDPNVPLPAPPTPPVIHEPVVPPVIAPPRPPVVEPEQPPVVTPVVPPTVFPADPPLIDLTQVDPPQEYIPETDPSWTTHVWNPEITQIDWLTWDPVFPTLEWAVDPTDGGINDPNIGEQYQLPESARINLRDLQRELIARWRASQSIDIVGADHDGLPANLVPVADEFFMPPDPWGAQTLFGYAGAEIITGLTNSAFSTAAYSLRYDAAPASFAGVVAPAAAPEPTSAVLLALAAAILSLTRRRN
jgi:hypothetical protein